MKISRDQRLPLTDTVQSLRTRMFELFREVIDQLNQVSEHRIAGFHNAQTAIPTQGANAWGDFIPNKEPTELGTAGSKYVVTGWTCTVAGTPGTWVECRSLTGN